MRALALAALLLPLAAIADDLPVVQCPTTVQGEEENPPFPVPPLPQIGLSEKAALAFYVSQDYAVLAPRGWQCHENSGSSGSGLIVAPDGLEDPIQGPGLTLGVSNGGTSGRFAVAKLDAELFPQEAAFTQSVKDEGFMGADYFPAGPPPTDKLTRLGPRAVEFVTPADHDGIGTQSGLAKGPLPIQGVALHEKGGDGDVELLTVRLPKGQETLIKAILSDVERRWGN